jgi:hypothetical protein
MIVPGICKNIECGKPIKLVPFAHGQLRPKTVYEGHCKVCNEITVVE